MYVAVGGQPTSIGQPTKQGSEFDQVNIFDQMGNVRKIFLLYIRRRTDFRCSLHVTC